MLTPVLKRQFVRDYQLALRRGKSRAKIERVLELLCKQQPLPASLCDHPLRGEYAGCRDCHIEPDLLLIYRIDHGQLHLICLRLGSHSDLF